MSRIELDDEGKFMKHLAEYWGTKGITQIKIPQIGGQELNMFKLYRTVCKKGGGQAVSHNKQWKEIVDQFGLPSTCTSASFTLKNHYQKYLLGYEQRYFFGKEDGAKLPELVPGRQRRAYRPETEVGTLQSRLNLSRAEHEQIQATLHGELKRHYDKADSSTVITFVKRSKLHLSLPDLRRAVLGLEGKDLQENVFAVNYLTLLSLNTETQLHLEQHLCLLDAVQSFMERHYPPKGVFSLECLRGVTLALRNMMIDYRNHAPLLQSSLLSTLWTVFQAKPDRETTRNLSDLFSSLTHSGFDAAHLLSVLDLFYERDSYQDLDTFIDLLRSVVEQKEELCQTVVCHKLPLLSRLLLHFTSEVREASLQIMSYLSDRSLQLRRAIMENRQLLERVCGMTVNNSANTERQSKFASNIVRNLAQSHEGLQELVNHQRILMASAFHNQNISSVMSDVLFRLGQL